MSTRIITPLILLVPLGACLWWIRQSVEFARVRDRRDRVLSSLRAISTTLDAFHEEQGAFPASGPGATPIS